MRLGEDYLGLALRLVLHMRRGLLRDDQRLRQRVLPRLQLAQLALHRLDLVCELVALAPHRLEAVGDLREQVLDGLASVPEECPPDADVSQLNGCVGHATTS